MDFYIIVLVFREEIVPFFEEGNELARHIIEVLYEAVGIDITVSSSHGVIDEKQIRKFIPAAIVIL